MHSIWSLYYLFVFRQVYFHCAGIAGWEGMAFYYRYLFAYQFLNGFQVVFFFLITKRKSNTRGTGAARAAYTVYLCFRHFRQVEIDNVR